MKLAPSTFRRCVSITIVSILFALVFWLFSEYLALFRRHLAVLIFLVVFMPALAFWISTSDLFKTTPLSNLILIRNVLPWIAIALSLTAIIYFDSIRDIIGEKFVDGYHVTYYEDLNEYGLPSTAAEIKTDSWLSRFGLWLFELLFVAGCIASPILTWFSLLRLVERRKDVELRNDGLRKREHLQ